MEKNDHLVGYWIDKSLSVALGFSTRALLLGRTCARLCTWSLSKVIRVNKQLPGRKLVTRLRLFPSGDETACFVRTLKTSSWSWSGVECWYFLTGREKKRKVAENTLAILNSDGAVKRHQTLTWMSGFDATASQSKSHGFFRMPPGKDPSHPLAAPTHRVLFTPKTYRIVA